MTKIDPVVRALIHKVLPNVLAQDITSVQPMTGLSNLFQNWVSEYDQFNEYPYSVNVGINSLLTSNVDKITEMVQWANGSIPRGSWHHSFSTFMFKNEEDRTAFILRWRG